jgi:hypothetical protein
LVAVFFVAFLAAFLALAQRAFIAADMAALPLSLNFLFFCLVTLGSVDLGRPGPFFIAALDSNARTCLQLGYLRVDIGNDAVRVHESSVKSA